MQTYDARGNGDGETVCTITGDHENRITDYTAIAVGGVKMDNETKYIVRRLTPLECTRLQGYPDGWVDLPQKADMTDEEFEQWQSIRKVWTEMNGKEYKMCKNKESMLKWYNGMVDSDSAKYKAIGNSIATGPNSLWEWIMKRISAQYDRRITLGSLFDGIGGFPLVFEQINGRGSCKWASEVEPFPIAVTKVRFPENDDQ